ncbi:MAG: hypothetical protein Q8R28_04800 [Dehalococcoidia bacterium]|nr:hypothetical protein [Dehalococcoidia bacterium]
MGLLLTLVVLALPMACSPPAVTRTKTVAENLLVASEMREEGSTVWAINPSNLQDKRLLGSFHHQPGFPLRGSVSPDGASIALSLLPPGADRFSGARLVVMAKDGSSQTPLEEGIDYDVLPVWSPDSQQLAFVKRAAPAPAGEAAGASEVLPAPSPTEVYASSLDGKSRRLLFKDSQSLDLYLVGWPLNGKSIIYRRFTSAGDQLWSFDLASGQSQSLSTLSKAPAYGVRLSPDGASVVASVRQEAGFDVVSQSLEGQNRRVLSKANRTASNPLFAPDGRRVAFDAEPLQQGASSVGIMDVGAEAVTQLSSPAGGKDIPLSFSPDGNWLLVRHSQDGRAQNFLLRVSDGVKEYLDAAYWLEPVGWIKG